MSNIQDMCYFWKLVLDLLIKSLQSKMQYLLTGTMLYCILALHVYFARMVVKHKGHTCSRIRKCRRRDRNVYRNTDHLRTRITLMTRWHTSCHVRRNENVDWYGDCSDVDLFSVTGGAGAQWCEQGGESAHRHRKNKGFEPDQGKPMFLTTR